MDKKGLNFLVGLGGLWLLWKIYATGWLHRLGFLAINYATGSDLVFNTFGDVYGFGSTPLAIFAALLIDAIAVFGSLIIVFASGIWDILLQAGEYLKDLFIVLKEYLDGAKKEIKDSKVEESVDQSVPVVETKTVKENPMEIILLELKAIRDSQVKLEEEVKVLKGEPNE